MIQPMSVPLPIEEVPGMIQAMTVPGREKATGKPAGAAGSAQAGIPIAAIEAYVNEQMRRLRIPGLAVAMVEGEQVVYQRGFGRARPGGGPPTGQTPFVLGSTAKSFTALAVMQLVEGGRIDLDAPVRRYLRWFRTADRDASDRITVRQLLHQTSGLPGGEGMRMLADLDAGPGAAERQCRTLATARLHHAPGERFEYSNLNYNLLGLVIEVASGESYADYVQRHIFDPLGMRHSFTSQAAAQQAGPATGHRYWFAYPVPTRELALPRGSLASGQLMACAEDMARYLVAHLNGGRAVGASVLAPAGMAELHRGAVEASEFGVVYGRYGMGWVVSRVGPDEVIWHGGNVPDYSSFMALLPGCGRGVVLLVNADHFGLPPVLAEVGMGLAALLAGQEPEPSKLAAIPWAMRGLALIPLLQLAGVAATVRLLGGARKAGRAQQPRQPWLSRAMWVPLLISLPLALAHWLVRITSMQGYLRLFMPDLYWTLRGGGAVAAAWSLLCAGLLLRGRKGRRS